MKKYVIHYEIFMLLLIIVSLFFAFSDNDALVLYDRIIWMVFVLDYTIRLVLAKDRWEYVKKHPFELIAIIPLDAIFRAARFVRFFRILRLVGIGSRFVKPVYGLLRTNGLDKLLTVAVVLLFIIPIPIILVEPGINTFSDALWWAIVTTTTVGYGDISPTTPLGRVLAVILMLVGIGIIGTFTSSITSYFGNRNKKTHNEQVLELLQSIEEIDNLTAEDVELVEVYLKRKVPIG
ncbi:potassium channel family protein [Planococcus salinus]|uniref:Two pore domain potassium channel family protein n=1 Tax=Planococcus salinus TaxID=1848460 RepID=A0A3M8PC27_9BACL|nr:potassium channel family protein [Planococcus salinus]RNF41278.1 two pore domain potassium channel family protein [Planococcus salinus]